MWSLGDLRNPARVHVSSQRGYIHRVLERRYFTHCLQVVLPGTSSVPQALREVSEPYHLIRSLPLEALLDFEFIQAFVSHGQLTIISAYGPSRENTMAITPDGKLTLSLGLDLYYKLGLEASQSEQLLRKRGFDQVVKKVEIDLKHEYFYPGRSQYERVVAMAKRHELAFDVLLEWRPPEAAISPESPVVFLKNRWSNLEYSKCTCRYSFCQRFDVAVPPEKDVMFFDWLGVLAAGGKIHVESEVRASQVVVAQWTGLISRHALQNMISKLLQLLGPSPFVALTSVGFASDPTLRRLNTAFNMDSTLSVCFEAGSTRCSVFECPPL